MRANNRQRHYETLFFNNNLVISVLFRESEQEFYSTLTKWLVCNRIQKGKYYYLKVSRSVWTNEVTKLECSLNSLSTIPNPYIQRGPQKLKQVHTRTNTPLLWPFCRLCRNNENIYYISKRLLDLGWCGLTRAPWLVWGVVPVGLMEIIEQGRI